MHRFISEYRTASHARCHPVTWGDDGHVKLLPCSLFAFENSSGQVVRATGSEEGAISTAFSIPPAAFVIVTATGERPHVMDSPDDGTIELGQVLDAQKSVGHPMQVDHIGIQIKSAPNRVGGDNRRGKAVLGSRTI